jgi:hypothetical protein
VAAPGRGRLTATAGDLFFGLRPPLVIDTQHIDEAVAVLRQVLA